MASLVRRTLGRNDLKDSDVRIAVWVAQFVASEARGLGIDAMLLAKIMDRAHSNGYTHLLFVVDNRSPELHDLLRAHYESQGCVAIPEDNDMGLKRAMLRLVQTSSTAPVATGRGVDEHQEHTLEASVAVHGISLANNAFVLAHGYVSVPLLFEFAREVLPKLLELQSAGVEELSSALQANIGPLSVVLRTARVLGFVRRDPTSGDFLPIRTPELEALCEVCAAGSDTLQVLQQIYEKAAPPFRMSSSAASLCLRIWRQSRDEWHQRCTSPAVCALLDGVVLTPVLTSLVYFNRWDEVGVDHGGNGKESMECPGLDAQSVATMDSMLREIGVGGCSSDGTIHPFPGGALALQRVYTFFAATSYCPLLSNLHRILFEDAAWGFVGQELELAGREQHVDRTLNVVGSGAQHRSFFRDFCKLLGPVFSTQDFSKQPALVVDTGCGDGTLLAQIYAYVRDHTPRGRLLDRYPLTVVGVDFNEASREATTANLAVRGIPHIVMRGDIGNPADISAALAEAGADPSRAIHVRSFLDHDRPFIPPARAVIKGSARDAFIDQQFADVVHLDKSGMLINGSDVYQSLVEHFERWGNAVDGSHGLCLLEVMVLDELSTRRCFGDNVSFHFDIEEALSRQYLVPPVAFHLALAEAGLFSQIDYRDLQTYPESGECLRILSQHVTKRPFRVRFAELEDVQQLLHLEEIAVAKTLRADHSTIVRRLLSASCEAFVLEAVSEVGSAAPGTGKLVAALYTTRIASEGDARSEIGEGVGGGPVMQIVALSADPEGQGAGALLRDFALQLARLDPSVRSVVGITRCEGWCRSKDLGLEEYVAQHQAGGLSDKILGFHTLRGAEILRLLPGIRRQDHDNDGAGVLIRYAATAQGCRRSRTAEASQTEAAYGTEAAAWGMREIEQAIWAALAEVGVAVEPAEGAAPSAEDGFAALGVDSLDLARLGERLTKAFGVALPTSLLLERPSVSSLVPEVERMLKRPGRAGGSPRASGLSRGSSADLVRKVLEDLGFEAARGSTFLDIGLDSIDLTRVRRELGEGLGLRLPDTLCLDYPSPPELVAYLDAARAEAQYR